AARDPAIVSSLPDDQAQGVDFLPRPPLEADRDLALARDIAGAAALGVSQPGGVVRVGGLEVVPLELHEDHLEAVDRQPRVRLHGPDRLAPPGDGRRLPAEQLAVPLAVDELLADPVDGHDRTDLRAPEAHDVADPGPDQHPAGRGDVEESVAI